MELKTGEKTLIMGIINATPDSFYDGGNYQNTDNAIRRAYELYEQGADIIDIGGESTRPGAETVSLLEELDRVCPIVREIANNIDIPVSIDTYKSEVAEEALKLGAGMVNDISGLTFDYRMADIVSKYNAHIILMHIKGTPKNMQKDPHYDNLLEEIYTYLCGSKEKAIDAGIPQDKIIVDPGIGFGKTLDDNYIILKNLEYFKKLDCPVLIGLSRKSLIGKLYDRDYDRLYATIALNAISAVNGADIIRVHDVKEHVLALKSVDKLKGIGLPDANFI